MPSSPSHPTYGLRPRPLLHVDRLSLSSVGVVVLGPTSYLDVVHTKWHLIMVEDIATIERIGTWDIVSLPPGLSPSLMSRMATCSHHLGLFLRALFCHLRLSLYIYGPKQTPRA